MSKQAYMSIYKDQTYVPLWELNKNDVDFINMAV